MAKAYQDYVFKDGTLIGEFDKMYQESEEIPWKQDKTAHSLAVDFDLNILKKYLRNKDISILDNGCGIGYVTDRLKRELNISDMSGCDISENAIAKAAKRYPEINFFVKDMLGKPDQDNKKYDLIYIKDILWYVVDDLEIFMRNILSMLKSGGMIYAMQSFPDAEEYYGKNEFPKPESILNYYERDFDFKYKSIIKENYNAPDSSRVENDYRHEFYIRFLGMRSDGKLTLAQRNKNDQI